VLTGAKAVADKKRRVSRAATNFMVAELDVISKESVRSLYQ
jgi:hypothetical protein